MGRIINAIISNDLLFYGMIIFLITGVILLFIYLHHKSVINLLEEEVDNPNLEEDRLSASLQNLATLSSIEAPKKISDNRINILDEEIKFPKNDNDDAPIENDNNIFSFKQELEEKISDLNGKLAIEKILNEDALIDSTNSDKTDTYTVDDKQDMDSQININDDKEIKVKVDNSSGQDNLIEDKVKTELELVLEKMQHDLEEQKDKDAVAIFEQEQEEKSIISYKELLERKNELTSSELLADERFENEPIMIEKNNDEKTLTDSYVDLANQVNDIISIEAIKDESEQMPKKFVTTDFISPVFGRQKAQFDYPKVPNFKEMMYKNEKTNEYDLETTMNLEPLKEKIKKDDAFLSTLKEFRKNLE